MPTVPVSPAHLAAIRDRLLGVLGVLDLPLGPHDAKAGPPVAVPPLVTAVLEYTGPSRHSSFVTLEWISARATSLGLRMAPKPHSSQTWRRGCRTCPHLHCPRPPSREPPYGFSGGRCLRRDQCLVPRERPTIAVSELGPLRRSSSTAGTAALPCQDRRHDLGADQPRHREGSVRSGGPDHAGQIPVADPHCSAHNTVGTMALDAHDSHVAAGLGPRAVTTTGK